MAPIVITLVAPVVYAGVTDALAVDADWSAVPAVIADELSAAVPVVGELNAFIPFNFLVPPEVLPALPPCSLSQ